MTPPRIWRLPPQLANQIAAGEVVARPASVVKELIENALDAGARTVRIEIEGGGVELIRVVDDGHGMSPDDATLALERHATSKIRSSDDLHAIHTFGFRGEALPSIASVSRLTLRSRPAGADEGVEVIVDGGEPARISPCGCAPGTSVEVATLFYNVPARRKFLRAVATESAHVGDVIRSLALSHPEVQLELRRDARSPQRWLRASGRDERAAAVFSDYELFRCEARRGPISVTALLSKPDRSRTGAGGLYLFVCGRPVRDRALARAVATAYGNALDRGRYPVGAVFLQLPLELVDVNVHPQKAEVRFAHARAVTDAVYSVIAAGVAEALGLPPKSRSALGPAPRLAPRPEKDSAAEAWVWSDSDGASLSPAPDPTPIDSPAAAPHAALGWRRLSAVHDGIWLFLSATEVAFVDLRAARAALIAAAMHDELEGGRVVSQRLLFPLARDATAEICEALEAASERLSVLGFDLRRAGPRTLVLHALPRAVVGAPAERVLDTVVTTLARPADALDDGARLLDALSRLTDSAEGQDDEVVAIAVESRDELLRRCCVMRVGLSELSASRDGRGDSG